MITSTGRRVVTFEPFDRFSKLSCVFSGMGTVEREHGQGKKQKAFTRVDARVKPCGREWPRGTQKHVAA